MPTARSIAIGKKQSIPAHLRYTFEDFNREFPDDDTCLEYVKEQRFPGGMAPCDKCGETTKHHRIAGRTAYSCQFCGTQIYPLAGTIFEKSSTSLRAWFYAMYLMGCTRCGISAKQIQRETGVTYKTAWRIFRQIRTLMSEDLRLEGPTCEMDETYFGGKRKGLRGRPPAHDGKKIGIAGIAQRKGKVVARVMSKVNTEALMGMAKEYILPESTVYTDDFAPYGKLPQHGYPHYRIHHSAGVYVMGDIHTNTVEGFWSLIKRGIGGVYHAVSHKYLQSYLNEYAYRYNRRDQGNLIFKSILGEVSERAVKSPASKGCESSGQRSGASSPESQAGA